MATARPFGYNPSQINFPGVTNQGTLAINAPTDNDFEGTGIFWCMGPDEDVPGYIIAYVDPEGNHTVGDQGDDGTPGSAQAYVGFKRVTGSAGDFINTASDVTGEAFEGMTAAQVANYLNTNGNTWTNYPTTEEATTVAPTTTPPVTYFYAAVEACPDGGSNWTGTARSTQRLVRDAVYNVDTLQIYPPEAGEKVIVTNENAPGPEFDLEITDFDITNCGIE